MLLTSGDRLGAYEISEPIGRGGMGEVYRARDTKLGRQVAIKILPAHLAGDNSARERLRREAAAAAALDHPFICKVFEIGEDRGQTFLVMEFIAGETLHEMLQSGRFPRSEALRIAAEVAEALERAHESRFVHRDLKPANLMISQGHVKVMDFGLAKQFGAVQTAADPATATLMGLVLTEQGATVGTPDYMSPEQVRGEPLDPRSDVFSFGILLCELMGNPHPFRRSCTSETMAAILRDPPDLRGDLAQGLMVFIRRLLMKSPDERYQSIAGVRSDLARLSTVTVAGEQASTEERIPLIGREREFAELKRMLEQALSGRGSLVLVGGEPGIGKTHLTRAILEEAKSRGAFAVTGHCYEMEGALPYMPFVEILEYSTRTAPRESLRYLLGEEAPEVAKLMPQLRTMYTDIPPGIQLPPEQQRRFLFTAYRSFVERSAKLTPIVAVLEDLHWADDPTLQLLLNLAQTVSGTPMLLIGTYRDTELDVTRPFAKALESLVREKQAVRISLRRWPVTSVETMLTTMSGQQPPASLARVVFEETEGNPFFVEEVFRHLAEEGKLFDETGKWRPGLRGDQLQVPEGVRLVLGRRLDRLGSDARRILSTAAVIGRSFQLKLLEDLENQTPDAALDALEEAERAHLVAAEPIGRDARYRFVHELVRQTLAESLSLPRRQRLHTRIAAAIERAYGASQTTAIAHHLYQAGTAADPEKTITYLMSAARLAAAGAAYEEALANADKALELMESAAHPLQPDVDLARARALRSLARPADVIESYRRAIDGFERTGNVAAAADASADLAYVHLWNADAKVAARVVDRAAKRIASQPSATLLHLQALNAVSLGVSGRMDAAFAELSRAKETEAQLPDAASDGMLPMCEARVHFAAARMEQAAICGQEAIRRFRANGDLWGEAEVFEPVVASLWLGRVREVEALVRSAAPIAERVGHRAALWAYQQFHGKVLLANGKLEEAERAAEKAQGAAAVGWGFVDNLILGSIAYYCGRLDEAVRQFRRTCEREPEGYQSGQGSAALFLALTEVADPEADSFLSIARQHVPIPGTILTVGGAGCLALILEGLAVAGRWTEAAALLPQAELVIGNGPCCMYTQHLFRTAGGIAAAAARDWGRAEEHFRIAMHQSDSSPYTTAQPIARFWYAGMLRSRGQGGDHRRALDLLGEASSICERVGMPWHARRTQASISALP